MNEAAPMGVTRSENMRRIRGRDTRPEVALRTALTVAGVVVSSEAKAPVGRPDVVFPEQRVAVFVHGCQWHGCPEHGTSPKTNAAYWSAKIARNVERDRLNEAELSAAGWVVVRVWEHEVPVDVADRIARILSR